MFLGDSTNTLDSKGRLVIPAMWRTGLTDSIVVQCGYGNNSDEKYLQISSRDKFLDFIHEVDKLPPTDTRFIKAMRFILPNAFELAPDKQGRILIPQRLVKYAGLSGEVLLVGMSSRIEIWNPTLYEKTISDYSLENLNVDLQALADRSSQDGAK